MPESRLPNGTFAPGSTGNPGGRPKGVARRVRESCQDEEGNEGGKLVSFLLGIVESGSESTRDRIAAAGMLWDRGWGKAPQLIDVEQTSEGLVVRLAFDPSEHTNGHKE
jgi:hypothetical protein